MRGSHGVCDCDILRRANVKADLYLLRGGSSEPSEPPLGTGMGIVKVTGLTNGCLETTYQIPTSGLLYMQDYVMNYPILVMVLSWRPD